MNKIRTAFVLAASLALTGVAFAQAKVVPAQSQITFAIKEMGVPVEGKFGKWTGATILALAALRLLWRLTHRPPAELPAPKWQHTAASVTHWALYALFFGVPLVGWAYSSAAGFPLVVFGVLPLPDFVPKDHALAETLKGLHGDLAWVLCALVALHVAAVGKHMIIDRDGLLRRMMPGRA